MTILQGIFGNFVGLDHSQRLVGNQDQATTGYDAEVFYAVEGLRKTTITSAQLLALNATPQSILPAPPTGFVNLPLAIAIYKAAGTAYAGIASGEDLAVQATNGSGQQQLSVIETTGFLDSAAAQIRYAGMTGSTGATAADITPLTAALVLHLLVGEITTGTSDLIVWVWYRRLPTVLTA